MDKTELLEIFTRQQRIEVEYPDMKREVEGSVVRLISLAEEEGYIIYSRLDEGSVEDAISAQIARFESIPQDFEWKVYDYDPPKDLIERLRRRGFLIGEAEALVVLDLTAGLEALDRPVPPSVVRITDPGEIDAIVTLENAVWESDQSDLGEFLKRDLRDHPEMLSVFISYQGTQPVSAAWIYFHVGTKFASLYGGATLPQFRNQGHYSLLLAARAQEARARGFSLLAVDASPMSRPVLEKHGFQYLATTTPCKWRLRSK
jgi:GNAT superfamily N-acetyltransferase